MCDPYSWFECKQFDFPKTDSPTMRLRILAVMAIVSVLTTRNSPAVVADDIKVVASVPRPNVIIIYADDLGYGDLGCYGQPTIRTPNVDRMAAEGMRFTQFYSAAEVCTPSRTSLLTGRYPIRSGMCHDQFRVLRRNSTGGLPKDELTLPEMLKSEGYQTGMVGKWHLGHLPEHLPTHHGFDEYFGMPYSNDMLPALDAPEGRPKFFAENNDFWRTPLIRGAEIVDDHPNQREVTRQYTDEAITFIRNHKSESFFLYVAHTFPHVPLFASERFRGRSPAGIYGDVVEELDWSVGQILDTLRNEQLAENTMVIFSSDNGPWLIFDDHGGSAGPLRDGKGSTWEGGMRVPGLFWWPGHIPAGITQQNVASTMDILPTCAALCRARQPDRVLDGADLSRVLLQNEPMPREPFFYYRGAQLFACRLGPWKAHFKTQAGYGQKLSDNQEPPLLFHLEIDPSEKRDVAAKSPDVISQIRIAVSKHLQTVEPVPSQLEGVVPKEQKSEPNKG